MSDPKNPRKPRFYRPQEHGLEEPDAAVSVPRFSEKAASGEPTENPGAAPTAPLHQPREKRAKADAASLDDTNAQSAGEPGGQATTVPTLKDIKRGFRWTALLMSAVGGLAMMAFISWLHSHIEGLLKREDWIGWLALGLVAIVIFVLLVIAIREFFALRRLKKLGNLRESAERALKHDDRKKAQRIQSTITKLFSGRKSLKWGLAELKEHKNEVLSSRDRLRLVERSLMVPLDNNARKIVADSAKRVSVMTAISPFVFLDMLLVAVENFRMMRRLMALYGGRPGMLSQIKMIKMMISNLVISGGVAVGADLIGHVVGRQVATRLAGRIGEGVVNGSLTARLGITATKLIRPLPYIDTKPVSIKAFVKELTRGAKKEE